MILELERIEQALIKEKLVFKMGESTGVQTSPFFWPKQMTFHS